jgi:SPP1 gp7 family putative phage head morphogenesis protein
LSKIKSLHRVQIDDFKHVLDDALERGVHVNNLRKTIQERYEVTRSKAALLARDQTLKLNGQITRVRQTSAGVERYRWISSRDERVRPAHKALHGTVQRWDTPPVVDPKTGRTAHPGEDYQCRCVPVPELPELTPEGEALFASAF